MTDKTDQVAKLVDGVIAQLMEHVSSVQVFVTYQDGDSTIGRASGRGDWYARQGVTREWVTQDDERTRAATRREAD